MIVILMIVGCLQSAAKSDDPIRAANLILPARKRKPPFGRLTFSYLIKIFSIGKYITWLYWFAWV
jgi:hypothetical protein